MGAISLYRKNSTEVIESTAPLAKTDLHRLGGAGLSGRRLRAFLIDFGLITAVTFAVVILGGFGSGLIMFLIFPFISIIWVLTFIAYFTLFLSSKKGASLGMRRAKIALRLRQGERLSYKAALWRVLIFLGVTLLLTPLVLLMIPLTRGKRGLHDVLTGTVIFATDHNS